MIKLLNVILALLIEVLVVVNFALLLITTNREKKQLVKCSKA